MTGEFAPAVVLVSTPPSRAGGDRACRAGLDPFQVAFDKAAGVGLVAKTVAPSKDDDGDDQESQPEPEPQPDPVDAGGGSGGAGGGGVSAASAAAIVDALPAAPPVDAAPPAETEPPATQAAAAALAPVAAPVLAWHDDIGAKALARGPRTAARVSA